MGSVSGIDDFVFPPGQAFRFGSLDFITNDFGKISLLDSDSNQSGRDRVSAPFGIPNSAEIYPKLISIESAPKHSDEIPSTSTPPDQDDGAYSPILMKLPDDLAAVFTTRTSSPCRPRRDPASAPIRPSSKEVGVILQPLGTVSTDQLEGYFSSPGVNSRLTEIVEYDEFGYRYDNRDLDDFDESFEDNYTPLYFGVFMADNETEEQRQAREAEARRNAVAAITLLDTLLKEDALNQADHVVNILNQTKTMIAASVPLHGLPRGTIGSWAELRDHFIANYQGTFERPDTQFDLYNVIQKSGESLRDYIRRFSEQRNKISDITDDVIIAAFTKGIRHEDLVDKFRCKPPRTVKQMFDKANEYTKAEDAIIVSRQSGTTWKPKKDAPTTGEGGSNNHKDHKRKPEEPFATTTQSSRQRSRVNTFDKIMNSQCPHHPNSNHAAKDCFVYRQFAEQYAKNARKASAGDQSTSKKKNDDDDALTGFQDHRKELNHIFGGPLAYESKRKQKLTEREINAVQPDTPQYLRWSETTIKFDRSDHLDRVVHPRRYPLVLDPVVRNIKLRRSLIDGGSALNILFAKTLDDMQIPRTELKPSNAPFHGVIPGLSATPLGQITLPVTFGTRENFRTENICFEVADFETAYHAILGRPALAKFMAVPHYTYMMMKMPGPRGIISLRSDIKQAVTCDKESCEMAQTHEIAIAREDIRLAATTASEGEVPTTKISKSGESEAKTKKIPLDPFDPTKTAESALITFLQNNKDIFAWKPSDMPGIPREVIEHSLLVKEDAKPIKQRLRRFAQDRKDAIKEELTKLLAAGFIKEVLHPDWLANPVLVRKKTGQWCMCVDYTDLNKSCPKDPFGLPRIDQIVDSTAGCELLSFLDCYSGYHQIRLKESDCLKTSFITPFGAYCYITMPFGLKNAGATYQRMIQRCFSTQIGRNVEAYVDDVVVKTKQKDHLITDLEETFASIRAFRIKLNPEKCTFGVPSGKLLGFMVSHRGIQANLEKINAILNMKPPSSQKDVQKLTGCMAALSRRLIVHGYSQLVVNQVMKEWSCLDDNMTTYRQEVRKLEDKFDGLELTHVLRHNNETADRLANFGSKHEAAPSDVFVEHLYEPTIPRKETVEATDAQDIAMIEADWREPLIQFLTKQELPQDKDEAERISRRSRLYIIHEAEQYKKSPSGILQRCVSLEEGRQLLKDIHSGICGNHASARTIVGKAYRQGFFWPTAVSDADKIVRTCEGCQFFARQTHLPAQELQTIPLSWPFAVWGRDMVGPFKKAVGGYTHLFVAVDKFSKWIEAKPVITITADKARDFFINIVRRFGVPNRIITDNGTQFTGGVFKDFCEDFDIKICYASVAHPMSNGQVERANGMVLQGIKARVFDRLNPYAGKWVEQLPSILWSLCTTLSRATGQSPFFLVYGAEAMLPSEVEFESLRFRNFREERYGEDRVDDLNQLEEAREAALIQSARYLQGLRRYHNRNVRSRAFLVGDLVLRKIQTTRDRHKLSLLWEGSFIISEVTRPGSYRLKCEDGTPIDNSWNIKHLRRFYA
uniref:Retrotransposon protein, putative, Ty3-gypsy subclass n=1 Tax=Oryza sativa subsp. japonica TaxID=39947 RepID=Q2QT57_ORYSJ|nr:retrotransposon protein, putative, Ty3-gypsy subclass [Oryza sativa Japonica Group]